MDWPRVLLLFCGVIISTELHPKGSASLMVSGMPVNSTHFGNYGIMGNTDEEDSDKWGREQDKQYKDMEAKWHRMKDSVIGGSGSGSDPANIKQMKPGHKRQMGYVIRKYANETTDKIVNEAVIEAIEENTTIPPPMPAKLPPFTVPTEPVTYLPNIQLPQVTQSEAQNIVVGGGGGGGGGAVASTKVNVTENGQNLVVQTTQKGVGVAGNTTRNTYNLSGPKPGFPTTLNVGEGSSNINVVDTSGNGTTNSQSQSSSQTQQQAPSTTNPAPVLPTQPTQPVQQNSTSATQNFGRTVQNIDETSQSLEQTMNQGQIPINVLLQTSLGNEATSGNSAQPLGSSNQMVVNSVQYQQPTQAATQGTAAYLGGVHVQYQQQSMPTRSTVFKPNGPSQRMDSNTNPSAAYSGSVSPAIPPNTLPSGSQTGNPSASNIISPSNNQHSFEIKLQTEVDNPSQSTNSSNLEIRPLQIGRTVSQSKDGSLVISSSSIYEVGNGFPLVNFDQNQNKWPQSNQPEKIPSDRPSTTPTMYASNSQATLTPIQSDTNAPASPTYGTTKSTTSQWMPTYSLLKSVRRKPEREYQSENETSANTPDEERLPIMIVDDNLPSTKPIQLMDKGNLQRPTQLPTHPTASTSMFSLGSSPTVVGVVNPTADISTAVIQMNSSSIDDQRSQSENSTQIEETWMGSTTGIEDMSSIPLTDIETEQLFPSDIDMNDMNETNEEMFDKKDGKFLEITQASEESIKSQGKGDKTANMTTKPAQEVSAKETKVTEGDSVKEVTDALVSVDISQLKPGQLLSIRLPNSQSSTLFKVREVKSKDKVSTYTTDLDNDSRYAPSNRDKKQLLYAIIDKVKYNERYRNAMKALFSTGDRRSEKGKTIKFPERAILRSYSPKGEAGRKAEAKFSKYFPEDDVTENSVKINEKAAKKSEVFAKLLSDKNKLMHTLLKHPKSRIGTKTSRIHQHHSEKERRKDVKATKKTKGMFEVTLNISEEQVNKKKMEEKSDKVNKKEKSKENDVLVTGKKLKYHEEKLESNVKKVSSLTTTQTSQELESEKSHAIIEDERGNVLYKGPVDITALNETVARNGGSGTAFQLKKVGYKVDSVIENEESKILNQGLKQVILKERGYRHKSHRRRRHKRSVDENQENASKKTDGIFQLTLKVSDDKKKTTDEETSEEDYKDDINKSKKLFDGKKTMTFKGTFTNKDANEEQGDKKKEKKEENEEKEEKEEKEETKGKEKKKKKEEEEEKEEGEEKEKKKKGKEKKEEEKSKEKDIKEEKDKKKRKSKKEEKEDKTEEEFEDNSKGLATASSAASHKGNLTNVVIEDNQGNVLYKGPVDVDALNQTVANNNGRYSGFHLEKAGFTVDESADPNEVEVINKGLQNANHKVQNNIFLLERRLKRSISDNDEPYEASGVLQDNMSSKKTDGTFTLNLSIKDEKKPSEKGKEEEEDKPDKDEYNSDSQDSKAKMFKGTFTDGKPPKENVERKPEEKESKEEAKEDSMDEWEKDESNQVSPHVIIEDDRGHSLYQGPVDILALNKSVSSKGGKTNYELLKTGYQLIKDPNQKWTENLSEALAQKETSTQIKNRQNDISAQIGGTVQNDFYNDQTANGTNANTIKIPNDIETNDQNQKVLVEMKGNEKYQDDISSSGNEEDEEEEPKGQKTSSTNKQDKYRKGPFFDATNSKVIHRYLQNPKKESSLHNSISSKKKPGESHSKASSEEDFYDEPSMKAKSNALEKLFSHIQKTKEKYNVMLTNVQKGSSSIGGRILQALNVDENKTIGRNENHLNKPFNGKTIQNVLNGSQDSSSSDGGRLKKVDKESNETHKANDNPLNSHQNTMQSTALNANQNVKQYQVLTLTRAKLKELLKNSQESSPGMPIADVPNKDMEKPITLILSGPYLDENTNKDKTQLNSDKIVMSSNEVNKTDQQNTNNNQQQQNIVPNLLQSNVQMQQAPNDLASTMESQYKNPMPSLSSEISPKDNENILTGDTSKAVGSLSDKIQISSHALQSVLGSNVPMDSQNNTIDQQNMVSKMPSNQLNMTPIQKPFNDANANQSTLTSQDKNSLMLPNEFYSSDDEKILIGDGGKTIRPEPSAIGAFKSQESSSGLNVLLKTPGSSSPSFLVQSKNMSPLKISALTPKAKGQDGASTMISVLNDAGQRIDCHTLPGKSSLTLLRCGSNSKLVPTAISTVPSAQATANALNLQQNDLPGPKLPQPNYLPSYMAPPDLDMHDKPQGKNTQEPSEYGYGTFTDLNAYKKASSDIKKYLDKEMNEEKNMIQDLLIGSSTPKASFPSNYDPDAPIIPFGFQYYPGAEDSNLFNKEIHNPQLYQYMENLNTREHPRVRGHPPYRIRRPRRRHKTFMSERRLFTRSGPWSHKKSKTSHKKIPSKHSWFIRTLFGPVPMILPPFYPQPCPWLLSKRCCRCMIRKSEREKPKEEDKDKDKDKDKEKEKDKEEDHEDLPEPTPSTSSMSEWEYLGRVLCSCPCCLECVGVW